MEAGTVQRIFDDHYPTVAAAHRLDERSRRAAWNIRTCRTPAQGYHIDECPNGDYRIRPAVPNKGRGREASLECGRG
jgi:hypothetical protein